MAALKTPRQWAELYQDAITAIVNNGISSYSIAGRTFTKQNLRELEELHRYWLGRYAEEQHGFVTYSDVRSESYEDNAV